MADRISDQARSAIESFVAERAITKIETGKGTPAKSPGAFGTGRRGGGGRTKIDDDALRREYEPLVRTLTQKQIAAHRSCSLATVTQHLKRLGLKAVPAKKGPPRRKPRLAGQKSVDQRRVTAAARARKKLADRRRFKTTAVPTGTAAFNLPADHESVVNAFPRFLHTVADPADPKTYAQTILKDGRHNSKIGGLVLRGRLRGAHIVTLTLAERTTCPRTCEHWRSCYGNADQHATRWLPGQALLDRLDREIADLCTLHRTVLVRLHYLGDFYDAGYLDHWHQLLTDFDNLHAFGFTAHKPQTPLGQRLNAMREVWGYRFAIRHSGTTGVWGSFTIDFPTERRMLGDSIVCPEQRDAMSGGEALKHCGNCCLCWQSDAPIVFVEH